MRDTYIQKKIKITDGIEICESVKLWNITNVSGIALLQCENRQVCETVK